MSDSSRDRPVVVIGAGHAGVHVAARLAEGGWPGGVVLLDEDDTLPYERPPLSKAALTDAPFSFPLLRPADYYESRGIELRVECRVRAIDRENQAVLLDDGTTLGYHRTVIATGARARPLPVPGAQLRGVVELRTQRESRLLATKLREATRVAVVGAGYIGLEVAAAAVKAGCETTVIELQDQVMARVSHPLVAGHFAALHRDHGTHVVLESAVTGIAESPDGLVVDLDGRGALTADLVVVGIGVVPNQELAQDAGLAVDDGVLVDSLARTSDHAIHAIGDVARFPDPDGGTRRLECVQGALDMATITADHILGRPHRPAPPPWFWTSQFGVRLQSVGIPRPDDEPVLRGDPSTGEFCLLHLRRGRLVAVDTVNRLGDFSAARRLVRDRVEIDRSRASDPQTRLAEAVA